MNTIMEGVSKSLTISKFWQKKKLYLSRDSILYEGKLVQKWLREELPIFSLMAIVSVTGVY